MLDLYEHLSVFVLLMTVTLIHADLVILTVLSSSSPSPPVATTTALEFTTGGVKK
jgi:hypothetical protein